MSLEWTYKTFNLSYISMLTNNNVINVISSWSSSASVMSGRERYSRIHISCAGLISVAVDFLVPRIQQHDISIPHGVAWDAHLNSGKSSWNCHDRSTLRFWYVCDLALTSSSGYAAIR